MAYTKVSYQVAGAVAHIILNNPDQLNAISPQLAAELVTALEQAADDPQVRVVLLSGAGKAFCAGGDIASFEAEIASGQVDMSQLVADLGRAAVLIRTMTKPVVASVHGAAAGAGLGLAILADFCIAADDTRFSTAFVRIGLVADTGVGFVLARTLGHQRAADLLLTGRVLGATDAKAWGLITEVVPAEELSQATVDFVGGLVTGPRQAFAGLKQQIWVSQFAGFEDYLAVEAELQAQCGASPDFVEGVTAFRAKRAANFVS